MARSLQVTFADGSKELYNGVPNEVTPEQFLARVAQDSPGKRVVEVERNPRLAQSPADFPRVSPQQQEELMRGRMRVLTQERESGTDPALEREIARTAAQLPLADETARLARRVPAPAAAQPALDEGAGPGGMVNPEFETGATQTATGDPLAWRGTAAGIGGGIAGAGLGALAGPITAAVGGVAGSALGTYFGTVQDELAAGKPQHEAEKAALDAAKLDIAFNVAGGIVLKVGGKVVATLTKGTDPWKWLMDRLPRSVLAAKPLPGERVFGGAGGTTAGELQGAAERGARTLSTPDGAPSAGQLTGQASILESAGRASQPGVFQRSELAQTGALEEQIAAFRAGLAGDAQNEFPGTALREVLTRVEDRVKEYSAPVWKRLAQSRDINIVDVSDIRALARQLIAQKDTFGAMDAAEQRLLRNIAAGSRKISPAEAQDVQSRFFGRARDLASSMSPNGRLQSLYTDIASRMRNNLDSALEQAVRDGGMAKEDLDLLTRVRDLYKEMNARVYNVSMRPALRETADEKVAGAIVRPGDVTSVRQLDALEQFAGNVDELGEAVFKGAPGQSGRQPLSGSTDVAVRPPPAPEGLRLPAPDAAPRELAVFVRQAEAAAADPKAAERFGKAYGAPEGRPLKDVAREAVAGVRAQFFEKYAGTPETLARLHQEMQKPEFKATFEALFPAVDRRQRLAIEELSQAAQILARRNVRGSTAGTPGMFAAIGSTALGPLAVLAARAIAVFTPRMMAESYTKPGFTATARWLLGAAAGNVGAPPKIVYEFLRDNGVDPDAQ